MAGALLTLRQTHAATMVYAGDGFTVSVDPIPNTVSASFAGPATAGDLLIAVVAANGNTTINSPGANWNQAINESGNPSQAIFYRRAAGGEQTVTATVSANPGSIGMHIYEYANANSFQEVSSNVGSGNAPSSGSVVTTVPNELVFAAFVINANTSFGNASWHNAGENFTEIDDFKTTFGSVAAYAAGNDLTNSPGTKQAAVTTGAAGAWRGQILRFQNDLTAPSAVANLAASNPTASSIDLSWTAPGDDGNSGTAASYDLRYSTSPITAANFDAATPVTGEPAPAAAGTTQSMTVNGLSVNTTYYFALKTSDEIPNISTMSNVVSQTTVAADTTAPSAVTDLSATNPGITTIDLAWTAPGDDAASGTARTYDVRYATSPITNDAEFAAATEATGEPSPSVAGSAESMTVSGLFANTTYYFAIKTSDDASNDSALSNSASATTLPSPDVVAPNAVSDLTASDPTNASIKLTWTAPGDDGGTGTATAYDIRSSTEPITDANFNSASVVSGIPTPAPAGTIQSFIVTHRTAGTHYYFAMKAEDETPNISGISNVAEATTLAADANPANAHKVTTPEEVIAHILPEICTTNPTVQLLLHAHNSTQVEISNRADFADASWQPYDVGMDRFSDNPWTLSGGNGLKTVYVRFKNAVGAESDVAKASVRLDQTSGCQTPAEEAHILTAETHELLAETNPSCLSDYAHAIFEPYLIDALGNTRGLDDQLVRVEKINDFETQYTIQNSPNASDGITILLSRVGSRVDIYVESPQMTDKDTLRLRIRAADRGVVSDEFLYRKEPGQTRFSTAIDLSSYPQLCDTPLVPHAHPGDLLRSTSSETYYFGHDLRRHAFPTEDVFRSWYPSSTTILTVADYQLADIPLGANVTMRPGSTVSILDAVGVYIVDIGSTLRRILTGNAIETLIHLINPTLLRDYSLGFPILSTSDPVFSLLNNASVSINRLWAIPNDIQAPIFHSLQVRDGRVVLDNAPYSKGDVEIRFRILDEDGHAYTSKDLRLSQEDKRISATIVREDFAEFQHLDPEESASGTWSIQAHFAKEGHFYMYVDFLPEGESAIILRSPLAIGDNPRDNTSFPTPDPNRSGGDTIYRMQLLTKEIPVGKPTVLSFQLTKDGVPHEIQKVAETFGHLLLFKHGEPNVYLHTHATDQSAPVNGKIEFIARFPSAGRYSLFPQLTIDGEERSFPITIDVP